MLGRALSGDVQKRGGQIHRLDAGAALGHGEGELACAAAGVENRFIGQVGGQPLKDRVPDRVAAGAHLGAHAGDRRVGCQLGPGLDAVRSK